MVFFLMNRNNLSRKGKRSSCFRKFMNLTRIKSSESDKIHKVTSKG